MQQIDSQKDVVPLSVDRVIDLIRIIRNDLVKDLLHDDYYLAALYESKYAKPLSNIKREFMKRDLKEMLISPVDLVHYAGLITHVRNTGTFALEEKNSVFFYRDVERVFVKYLI
jgi:hypothetical protein